jgi:hypothetical protein
MVREIQIHVHVGERPQFRKCPHVKRSVTNIKVCEHNHLLHDRAHKLQQLHKWLQHLQFVAEFMPKFHVALHASHAALPMVTLKISSYTNITLTFDFDFGLDHPVHGGHG